MQTLIAFITSHGQHAIEQDGALMVLDHSYSAAEQKSFFEWQTIPATARSVRLWLGY